MLVHRRQMLAWAVGLSLGLVGLLSAPVKAADPVMEKVAPYIQDTTVAVVHLDVTKVDIVGAGETVRSLVSEAVLPAAEFTAGIEKLKQTQSLLREAGIRQVVAVFDIGSQPDMKPIVFALLEPGKTGEPLVGQFKQEMQLDRAEQMPGMVMVGKGTTIDRLKAGTPANREDLKAAMLPNNPGAFRCAIGISPETKRVLAELLPQLPPEIPLDIKKMAAGFSWIHVSAQLDRELGLQCQLETSGKEATQEFFKLWQMGKQRLAAESEAPKEINELLGTIIPKAEGNSLKFDLNAKSLAASPNVKGIVETMLGESRKNAQAVMSSNNLRLFMLSMHNYHDSIGHFPMASSIKKDGKRLLSWRVYVLPYIEQAPLYQKFHLNEPWDSEHNKKLIAEMPKVFAAPTLSAEQVAKGMTTYVVPVGKGTMFSRDKGTKLQEVTDGTSNTIAMLEANEKNAVIWTKPDDIDVDAPGLIGKLHVQDGMITVAFADGSVHRIKTTISPTTLKNLLQMADGNVVEIP